MAKYIENETTELKKTLNKEFAKEVVAFLNTRDGTIYVGVDDDGNVVGVNDVNKTMLAIRDIVRDQILPSTENLCEMVTILEGNLPIVVLKVKKGEKLYYLKKAGRSAAGCFYRDGTSSCPMSEDEIEKRFIASLPNHGKTMLSMTPSMRNSMSFEILMGKLRSNGVHVNEKTFLVNYNLVLDDGRLNRLAELLSDENGYPLNVCVFNGRDKASYERRNEYGNVSLIQSYKSVLDFCKSINSTYVDVDVRPRKEKKMFDESAFGEAWINACVHNDWSTGISPQVYIFDDRMEIVSEGGLPGNMTEEEFLDGVSKPVNPDLMQVFDSCGIVERSGHGVPRVVEAYGKEAYRFLKSSIVVTIPFDKNGFHKDVPTISPSDHGNREYTILALIQEDPKMSRQEMSRRTGISERTVSRILDTLKKNGVILREDGRRGGHWIIIG